MLEISSGYDLIFSNIQWLTSELTIRCSVWNVCLSEGPPLPTTDGWFLFYFFPFACGKIIHFLFLGEWTPIRKTSCSAWGHLWVCSVWISGCDEDDGVHPRLSYTLVWSGRIINSKESSDSSHQEQGCRIQNMTFPVANRWHSNCSWILYCRCVQDGTTVIPTEFGPD